MKSPTAASGLGTVFVLTFALCLAMVRPALAQNLSPTISAITDVTVAEDTPTAAIPFTVHDAETAAASLTVTATSSNQGLVPTNNITFSIVPGGGGSNRTVTVTPLPNQFGTATINVTVRDGSGATGVERFILTVAPVNDRPTLDSIGNLSFCGCVPQQTAILTGITSGATNENQTLIVTATSSNPSVVPAPSVSYTSPNPTATLTFSPLNFSGVTTITVTVNDGGASNNLAGRTFTVTLVPDTTPPIITCPANITVDSPSPAGRAVVFAAQALDNLDGPVLVSCLPPPGSTFPVGLTTVICRSTDGCGNSNSCSFTVRVQWQTLNIARHQTNVTLSWEGSVTLEAADEVTGPWIIESGVASPYAVPSGFLKRFYRLRPPAADPSITVAESSNVRFRATVRFGEPQLQTVSESGEVWTRLHIPGTQGGARGEGAPQIPMYRRLLAVPEGADVTVTLAGPSGTRRMELNLYPSQPFQAEVSPAIDSYTSNPPPASLFNLRRFVKDRVAYSNDVAWPLQPVSVSLAGRSRDLRLALVEVAAGQYNAARQQLHLFDSVTFEISFRGGRGTFLSHRSLNPFETDPTQTLSRLLLNKDIIKQFVPPQQQTNTGNGETFLILTHPRYRAAADALAQWKNGKGILTRVFEVNDGGGPGPDTNYEIDEFIDQRYNCCKVRPSYLLLFGDAEDVPTWHLIRLGYESLFPDSDVATDFPYSKANSLPEDATDLFPDLGVGRIAVKSASEATTVVDKIVQYESDPPFAPDFYQHLVIPSYFECCNPDPTQKQGTEASRHFIDTAEGLRETVQNLNWQVQRIYTTGTSHQPDYVGNATPRFFANGKDLPYDISSASGFAWTGDAAEVIDAINAGRSIVCHLDHGWVGGWGNPGFATWDLGGLHNGALLPLVFNLDCSSGEFDADQDCLAEAMLKQSGGGAIGVFAWARWANVRYFPPVVDALSYYISASYSYPNGQSAARLGDMLSGFRFEISGFDPHPNPPYTPTPNAINHIRMFHLFGDPTLEPWLSQSATVYRLPTEFTVEAFATHLDVRYPVNGAEITALQPALDGLAPIGRGIVSNNVAHLNYVVVPQPGLLQLSASKPGVVSRRLRPVMVP